MKNYFAIGSIIIFLVFISMANLCPVAGEEQPGKQSTLFTIQRIAIAERIEDREPVGVAETFPASTEMVCCFIEASNIKEDTKVTFAWYYNGEEVRALDLPLKEGSRWRTFTYKNLRGQVGDWKVEIRDSAGNAIKSISFKVE